MSAPAFLIETKGLGVTPGLFFESLRAGLSGGSRLLTLYAREAEPSQAPLTLTAVWLRAGKVSVQRTELARESGFPSLTREFPALQIFEREIFEQHGLRPHGHPWLKPVRFSGDQLGKVASYPFYRLEGKEVHEVGVGPIHAGVIEPGHFRFQCLGETVHHLEIQLGYQHRGAEALLRRHKPLALSPIVETLAGDTSVAHAWASCSALEALAGVSVPAGVDLSRLLGLELERIAMHLSSLSGMANDIAFLQGAATYGRLRTTAINSSMLLCGSRLGRGWSRPGGVLAAATPDTLATVKQNLELLRDDSQIIDEHFLASRSVGHRLRGVGVLAMAQAKELGLVGMAARATGLAVDTRAEITGGAHARWPAEPMLERDGDCWARARLRIREIAQSLRWLEALLDPMETLEATRVELGPLAPERLAVGICEGWRGEVVHCLETGPTGALLHYKVQDPSLRNWMGVALAVRGNEISDFPICNKSFDLSYCGSDL